MSNIKQMPPRLPELKLADGFGDAPSLFNSRQWLQAALEAKGAKITGGGVGFGQADLDIVLEGFRFNVSITPIVDEVAKQEGK